MDTFMNNLEAALAYMSRFPGVKLFPAKYEDGSHRGHIRWGAESSDDPAQIRAWAKKFPNCYFCCNYRASRVRVIDIDTKKGKDGAADLLSLELDNEDLPETLTVATPSGNGRHLHFAGECAFSIGKIGANGSGAKSGIDIPGMTPVPGSTVPGKGTYKIIKDLPVAQLPGWWVNLTGEYAPRVLSDQTYPGEVDLEHNIETATRYIQAHPGASPGERDITAYNVACKVREYAISEEKCVELMLTEYEPKSGFGTEGVSVIEKCVASAYQTAQKPFGASAPEVVFADTECPEPEPTDIEKLNQEYAVAIIGAKTFVIQEKEDDVVPLRKQDFETYLQNQRVWTDGDKPKLVPLSKIWLESPERRQVEGICFSPEGCKPGWINLWRGFPIKPDPTKSCELYRRHVEKVICSNNKTHIRYVWAWLADMVQNPGGNKPGVALVLRGGRGTGKGMFARPLLQIFGRHGLQLTNREHLVGRFNHHLSDKILVFLDEAFWAGDKKSEGVLKGLITEPCLPVERKGVDAYPVDSYVRCIMASNEDWVVPAGPDERRFLVLDVNEEHKQDSQGYFKALEEERKAGGPEGLLAWLLTYDYSDVDLFHAPESKGRLDQKKESLEPVYQWWLDCLHKGTIYDHEWPSFIIPRLALAAFNDWAKTWHGNTYMSTEKLSRKIFGGRGVCTGFRSKSQMVDGERENGYKIPGLEEARALFDKFLGGPVEWEDFDEL